MNVYLLRHGIAEATSPSGDGGRALTAEGARKLEAAAAGWRRVVGHIDRVFCSTLVRARQTAEILRVATGVAEPLVETGDLVPSARPIKALELLQHELQEGTQGVALVGHEPHLGNLLGLLLTGSERTSIPFKKGMLVHVALESRAHLVGRLVCSLTQDAASRI